MPPQIEIIHIPSPIGYRAMLEQQRARVEAVRAKTAPNTLYLLQHSPVITLGRNAHRDNLRLTPEQYAAQGIDLEETDRGGDVTYHGPGQLVAYPILDLNQWQLSVGWYLRKLEQVLIELLADYGLAAGRVEGFTGVWVNGAKVAAIGVGVNKWITFHGIALNVDPVMDHFTTIIPCGITDKPVTSLRALLPTPPPITELTQNFAEHFLQTFEAERR